MSFSVSEGEVTPCAFYRLNDLRRNTLPENVGSILIRNICKLLPQKVNSFNHV